MQTNVIEYLWNTAAKYPTKVAVDDTKEQVTFDELLRSAKVIADAINDRGIKKSPICIYIPKSAKEIRAFAGVSLSCNYYVPLDIKQPDTRITTILAVIAPKLIITDRANYGKVNGFGDFSILIIEDVLESVPSGKSLEEYMSGHTDLDPVYTLFTSGSTGTPKGVVLPHKAVIDYIDWQIGYCGSDNTLVMGNQAAFHFDLSVPDLYLMYAVGATLVIIPDMLFSFPTDLVDFLNEKEINSITWVPSAIVNLANSGIFEEKLPKYLKEVIFCGEVMPTRHLNYWRHHLPNCRYINMYGPTEATMACTYYTIDREFTDDEPLPIGFACHNSDVFVLVDGKKRGGVNEKGEIAIAGTCLALGYYGDWEKSNKAFIQNPLRPDYREIIYLTGDLGYVNERGELMYSGRKDSQIKHNGYRIELGEIENGVLASHLVANCCVVYNNAERKIVMFYEADEDIKASAFRKGLAAFVPQYMLPTEFIREEHMKRNNNGKIDRANYNKQVNF